MTVHFFSNIPGLFLVRKLQMTLHFFSNNPGLFLVRKLQMTVHFFSNIPGLFLVRKLQMTVHFETIHKNFKLLYILKPYKRGCIDNLQIQHVQHFD